MSKFKIGDKVVVDISKPSIGVVKRFYQDTNLYHVEVNDRLCSFAEERLSHTEDDHPVYKDGKIDVKKLGVVIDYYGSGCYKLKVFSDSSGYIANDNNVSVNSLNGGDLNHLNTLYKEITASKKASSMDQIVKDSIEQEIKKMEDAIAELRKKLV